MSRGRIRRWVSRRARTLGLATTLALAGGAIVLSQPGSARAQRAGDTIRVALMDQARFVEVRGTDIELIEVDVGASRAGAACAWAQYGPCPRAR